MAVLSAQIWAVLNSLRAPRPEPGRRLVSTLKAAVKALAKDSVENHETDEIHERRTVFVYFVVLSKSSLGMKYQG